MLRSSTMLGLALAAGISGCAHYAQEEGDKLANEVYALSTQLQALQKATTQIHKTLERQDDSLREVDSSVDDLKRSLRRNDADLGVQVDEVLQEVARLKGLVEGGRERIETVEAEIAQLKEQSKISLAHSEDDKKKAIEAARERERLLGDPTALITNVVALIKAKQAGEARSLLREFSLRAKNQKRLRRYLAQVQFLIADSYFLESNYKRAAQEYHALQKSHAKSKKIPEALYKMARSFEMLELKDDARFLFSELRKQHPRSKWAKKARDRLKVLKKK